MAVVEVVVVGLEAVWTVVVAERVAPGTVVEELVLETVVVAEEVAPETVDVEAAETVAVGDLLEIVVVEEGVNFADIVPDWHQEVHVAAHLPGTKQYSFDDILALVLSCFVFYAI